MYIFIKFIGVDCSYLTIFTLEYLPSVNSSYLFHLLGDIHGVMVMAKWTYMSHRTNTLGKGMNPTTISLQLWVNSKVLGTLTLDEEKENSKFKPVKKKL